jgi:hypothetical protein
MNEGCEMTMGFLRDAGFQSVNKIPTDGQPGIFATLDAGAPTSINAARVPGAEVLYTEDLNHGQLFGSVRVINPFR